MNKEKLLEYLIKCAESKDKQIKRLVEEGSDDNVCVCEWAIYIKLINKIQKNEFDKEVTLCENAITAVKE